MNEGLEDKSVSTTQKLIQLGFAEELPEGESFLTFPHKAGGKPVCVS